MFFSIFFFWSQDFNTLCPQIVGLNTNIDFLLSLSGHAEFKAGNVHTSFIQQHYDQLFPKPTALRGDMVCQATLGLLLQEREQTLEFVRQSDGQNMRAYPTPPLFFFFKRIFKIKDFLTDC